MSYFVNKTDGTAIVVLDGTKDTTSTSLTLFGRLVQNYGDQTNENFVHLLENFALDSSPANPIKGQLWYDTNVNNIKAYNGSTWITVGTEIVGNVDLTGNLTIGPNDFQIKDLTGNVSINNQVNNGNISLFANVNGTSTNVLNINGSSGLITVLANATSNFGIPTKIYLDSEIQNARFYTTSALSTNVAIINANLTSRISEENQLRANLTAANAQIAIRATNNRVDQINLDTYVAISGNVETILGLIGDTEGTYGLTKNIKDVNVALQGNVTAINASIASTNLSVTNLNTKIDAVNLAQTTALVANINTKSDINSPTFTGTPVAPTATFGANTSQVATTQYVMTRAVFWDGSRKFISTDDPNAALGSNGDFWFKYS
jgi:hypothetical protein